MSTRGRGMSSGSLVRRPAGRDSKEFFTLHSKVYGGRLEKSRAGVPLSVGSGKCGGHVVTIGGVRTLRKTNVSYGEHYCRKHKGFGIDVALLSEARKLGVTRVLLETDRGPLQANLSDYYQHGVTDDLGWGRQSFLPERYFHRVDDPQLRLLEVAA